MILPSFALSLCPEMNKLKVKGYVAGILAAIFYGTNPLGSLHLYADGINPATVLFYRYALATVMFAVVMLLRRESFAIRCGHAIRLMCLGAFMAYSSVTLYVSFLYMDAGVASTILFSYPVMVAVLMAVFYHEHITWTSTFSIILATFGISLLYNLGGGQKLSALGMTLVLLSSLLYAVYIIAVQRSHMPYSALTFTFWIVLFGLVAILVYAAFAGEPLHMLHGAKEWLCATQLALLPTVLSLLLMTIAINNIGPTPSAILGALEPVTAVVIGVTVFGESFTLRLAVGIVLILSAVILIIRGAKSSQS